MLEQASAPAGTTAAPRVHDREICDRLDEIKQLLYRYRVDRAAQQDIISILCTAPVQLRRELAWRIICQGLDAPIIQTFASQQEQEYRAFMRNNVPELRRAREMERLEPCELESISAEIAEAQTPNDIVADSLEKVSLGLPGHDDIVIQEDEEQAFVTAMDGWIWQVDLNTGQARPFHNPPLMPAGAVQHPKEPKKVLFVTCRRSAEVYASSELGGLYELDVVANQRRLILDRVPELPETVGESELEGRIYPDRSRRDYDIDSLTLDNSRPASYFNDLAISADGGVCYVTESSPFASMGLESSAEVITMARNGLLWRVDLQARKIGLAAQNYAFTDGILVEPGGASVLVTELSRFRLLRVHLSGDKAGTEEVVWADLPGMPDGLDRDGQGRIWVALLKKRSMITNLVHRFNVLRRLARKLPPAWLPVPKETGFLVLSEDAGQPLLYTMHDGSRLRDVAAVSLSTSHVYLASYSPENRGLNRIPLPTLRKAGGGVR